MVYSMLESLQMFGQSLQERPVQLCVHLRRRGKAPMRCHTMVATPGCTLTPPTLRVRRCACSQPAIVAGVCIIARLHLINKFALRLQVRFKKFVWTHALTTFMAVFMMLRAPYSTDHFLIKPTSAAWTYTTTLAIDLLVPLGGTWLLEVRSRRLFLCSLQH